MRHKDVEDLWKNIFTSRERLPQFNRTNSAWICFGKSKIKSKEFIGLDLPIEVAPLRSSTSDILNLASIAAYSADVIDYKN